LIAIIDESCAAGLGPARLGALETLGPGGYELRNRKPSDSYTAMPFFAPVSIATSSAGILRCSRALCRLAWILLPVIAGGINAFAAATVAPSYKTVHTDESIVVRFSGGPGGAKDWIGVFPSGVAPEEAAGPELWSYVDGTQNGVSGFGDGSVMLLDGLPLAGTWMIYFFIDDSFTAIATAQINVLSRDQPILRIAQRTYPAHTTISVNFAGGPGNAKDWIGIYRAGQTPGTDAPTLRVYVDGTTSGDEGIKDGAVSFPSGVRSPGTYVAHLFRNNSNESLSSDTFEVTAGTEVRPVLGPIEPPHGSSNVPPLLQFSAIFTNGTSFIVPASVKLTLDGVAVPAMVTNETSIVRVQYNDPNLPRPGPHTWVLSAQDDATPPNNFQATSTFTVGAYRDLQIPEPIYFMDFDSVPEGSLPPGWTQKSYSSPLVGTMNFQDLASAAYSRWTSVRATRFEDYFSMYGEAGTRITDYIRILSANPFNVVHGKVHNQPLPRGNFLFANSGFQNRNGAQVLYLFTSGFNLSGRRGVHLGFKSIWEQNEDSMAAIEYSVDGGITWLPVAYYLDTPDIVMAAGGGSVDAVATLNRRHDDVARYLDESGVEVGGSYGSFIAASVSSALGPHIYGRINDDPIESKRIEFFPLPQADNQPDVRFRFVHAGTDSWYFGIDDLGLYSVDSGTGGAPTLQVTRTTSGILLSWPVGSEAYILETTTSLNSGWTPVNGVSGNSHPVPSVAGHAFFRLRR